MQLQQKGGKQKVEGDIFFFSFFLFFKPVCILVMEAET